MGDDRRAGEVVEALAAAGLLAVAGITLLAASFAGYRLREEAAD